MMFLRRPLIYRRNNGSGCQRYPLKATPSCQLALLLPESVATSYPAVPALSTATPQSRVQRSARTWPVVIRADHPQSPTPLQIPVPSPAHACPGTATRGPGTLSKAQARMEDEGAL